MDQGVRFGLIRKPASAIIPVLLVTSMFIFALNIQPAKSQAGAIYIRADGSIDPPTSPLSTTDNVTYTFADDIIASEGIVIQRSNIMVDGNGHTLQGSANPLGYEGIGFNCSGKNSVTIRNTTIKGFYVGIIFSSSSGNNVSRNNITDNWNGIFLYYSSDNSISENKITNNGRGIFLGFTNSSMITQNYVANCSYGVDTQQAFNNSINENSIIDSMICGIHLYSSSNKNTIVGNHLISGEFGIQGNGSDNRLVGNNIMNTTVSGISIFGSGNSISMNHITNNGYGISIGLSGNSISWNNITNNGYGIDIEGSSHTIIGNNITSSYYGIYLIYSSNNSMIGNNINDSFGGLVAYFSVNNSIGENYIMNNDYGIALTGSPGNNIFGNNITGNGIGIFTDSSNNSIYHNNFDNTQQVRAASMNHWDDGYPSGGNYWKSYSGTDLYSGPYQNITGSDGIGDTPVIIDASNTDRYPLMNQHVVPEFPTLLITSMLMAFILAATILYKRKHT